MPECHFFLEIKAPEGLAGIEQHLQLCAMDLEPWVSGYNGKVILRNRHDEERFEWAMDPSDTDVLVADGDIFMPVVEAWNLIKPLSMALENAGFSHRLGIDDEQARAKYSSEYLWTK